MQPMFLPWSSEPRSEAHPPTRLPEHAPPSRLELKIFSRVNLTGPVAHAHRAKNPRTSDSKSRIHRLDGQQYRKGLFLQRLTVPTRIPPNRRRPRFLELRGRSALSAPVRKCSAHYLSELPQSGVVGRRAGSKATPRSDQLRNNLFVQGKPVRSVWRRYSRQKLCACDLCPDPIESVAELLSVIGN